MTVRDRAIRIAVVSLLGSAVPPPLTAQGAPRLPSNVALVAADAFNDASARPLAPPKLVRLTVAEEAALMQALRAVPALPSHPYSGCHARAHLLFRKLNASTNDKMVKAWIFAGSTLAPGLSGNVGLPLPSNDTTSWGYHVAAAYTGPTGAPMIIDLLVAPGPIPVDRWLSRFRIAGAAVLTYLPARHYLFNNTEVPPLDTAYQQGFRQYVMTRNVFNGNFYEYTGNAALTHDGARDLAADAVAAALARGDFAGCEWRAYVQQPLSLKKAAAKVGPPAACRGAADLFSREVARWTAEGL